MQTEKARVIVAGVFVILIVGLLGIGVATSQNTNFTNLIDSFGKIHFNDGNIGSVDTDTASSTLVIERNTGRENLVITNVGSEVIYLHRKNYTNQAAADAGVSRGTGIPLYPQGSYETWDNEFLWTGDVWASTSTAAVTLAYDEK